MFQKTTPLISLFAENERKVKKLYESYKKIFPEDVLLWEELIEKEAEHVEILSDLENKFKKDISLFKENRFSRKIIYYISSFIDEELKKSTENQTDPIYAIETAVQLEQSMIENKCFDTFIPKSKEIKMAIKKLNDDTQDHIKLLRKALAEKK